MPDREDIFSRLRVDCYSGYRGEETPRCFYFGRRRVDVVNIVDRWLAPDHRYFKVGDADGNVYILRHDVTAHSWKLTSFTAHAPAPAGVS